MENYYGNCTCNCNSNSNNSLEFRIKNIEEKMEEYNNNRNSSSSASSMRLNEFQEQLRLLESQIGLINAWIKTYLGVEILNMDSPLLVNLKGGTTTPQQQQSVVTDKERNSSQGLPLPPPPAYSSSSSSSSEGEEEEEKTDEGDKGKDVFETKTVIQLGHGEDPDNGEPNNLQDQSQKPKAKSSDSTAGVVEVGVTSTLTTAVAPASSQLIVESIKIETEPITAMTTSDDVELPRLRIESYYSATTTNPIKIYNSEEDKDESSGPPQLTLEVMEGVEQEDHGQVVEEDKGEKEVQNDTESQPLTRARKRVLAKDSCGHLIISGRRPSGNVSGNIVAASNGFKTNTASKSSIIHHQTTKAKQNKKKPKKTSPPRGSKKLKHDHAQKTTTTTALQDPLPVKWKVAECQCPLCLESFSTTNNMCLSNKHPVSL